MKKGIMFSGSGGLFTYQMGIAKFLQKNYDLANIQFLASSGGVPSAFLLAINYNVDKAWDKWFVPWVTDSKESILGFPNNCYSYHFLDDMWPYFYEVFKDVDIDNCNLTIVLTKNIIEKVYETKWDSLKDLHSSMCTSCAIPFLLSQNLYRSHRNYNYCDGSFPTGLTCHPPSDSDVEWLPIDLNIFIPTELNLFIFLAAYRVLDLADIPKSKIFYRLGYKHAKENRKYFDDFLPPLK